MSNQNLLYRIGYYGLGRIGYTVYDITVMHTFREKHPRILALPTQLKKSSRGEN